jgi:hypothetical protein
MTSDPDSWRKWLEHITTCDAAHCQNANALRLVLVGAGMDPTSFPIESATDGTHAVKTWAEVQEEPPPRPGDPRLCSLYGHSMPGRCPNCGRTFGDRD